jgi:hypothetical protein
VAATLVAAYSLPGKFPFPDILQPEQKVVASNHHFQLFTTGLSFPVLAYHFWLFILRFSLKLLYTLLETTNRFDS